MALSRFVLTATVTVTPDALATPVAGEPGTGGAAGFGNTSTSAGYGIFANTFPGGHGHRARPGRGAVHGDRRGQPAGLVRHRGGRACGAGELTGRAAYEPVRG